MMKRPPGLRARVFARDSGRCARCSRDTDAWDVDHIKPIAEGGGHALTNLRTLCRECHRDVTSNWHTSRIVAFLGRFLQHKFDYRFEDFTDWSTPEPNTGCWILDLSRMGPDLGKRRPRGRMLSGLHLLLFGSIQPGWWIRTKCGLIDCVRPEHQDIFRGRRTRHCRIPLV